MVKTATMTRSRGQLVNRGLSTCFRASGHGLGQVCQGIGATDGHASVVLVWLCVRSCRMKTTVLTDVQTILRHVGGYTPVQRACGKGAVECELGLDCARLELAIECVVATRVGALSRRD